MLSASRLSQGTKGFSLIEILSTLALILIIASFTWQTFSRFFFISKQQTIKAEIKSLLYYAHQEAYANDSPVAFCYYTKTGSCSDTPTQQLAVVRMADVHHPFSQVTIPASLAVYFKSYPIYRQHLIFLPGVHGNNDNATLWLCSKKSVIPYWVLTLSQVGKMQMLKPHADGLFYNSQGKLISC